MFCTPNKKAKLVVNNKMKGALGVSHFNGDKPTGKIEINVKKHKGDIPELASTIKHELTHLKYPKMTEREVYKRTAKTKIPPQEQAQLLSKLRMSKINRTIGSVKKKFKLSGDMKPGDLITKMNESKITNNNQSIPKINKIAIMGLV